jgi:hypothetical protein
MNQNYGVQSINAANNMPDACTDLSPIAALLHKITDELSIAHDAVSSLDNHVQPIRANSPDSPKGEVSPKSIAPTALEQKLEDLLDTVRFLSSRIRRMDNELRI